MKGIVFTELMDMVSDVFGEDMWDDVLEDCTLESKGVYTAVAIYDHRELLQIVASLSKRTDVPVRVLVHKYGYHLFSRFFEMMPHFFEKPKTAFEFLQSVDGYIHVEVKKLYPEAQLPKFTTQMINDNTFIMVYESQCPFADFAEGLVHGCIDFFGENIEVSSQDQNSEKQYSRIFTMIKHG